MCIVSLRPFTTSELSLNSLLACWNYTAVFETICSSSLCKYIDTYIDIHSHRVRWRRSGAQRQIPLFIYAVGRPLKRFELVYDEFSCRLGRLQSLLVGDCEPKCIGIPAMESNPRNLEGFWFPFLALIGPQRDWVSSVDGGRMLGPAGCLGLRLICQFGFSVVVLLSLL